MKSLWLIISSLWSRQRLTGILFIGLTAALFFGDGRESAVVIFGAVVVSVLLLAAPFLAERRYDPPPAIMYAWSALLLYLSVRSVFSWDVGLSMDALLRFIIGFSLFWVFYTRSSRDSIHALSKWLFLFTFIALAASAIASLAGQLPFLAYRPAASLIVGIYGHHAIPDILLLTLPIVFWFWLNRGGIIVLSVLLLVLTGIALSFARGGIILAGLYLLFALLSHRVQSPTRKALGIAASVLFVAGAAFLVILPFGRSIQPYLWTPSQQILKPSFASDTRVAFWKEAWESVKQHPVFGTGPGTFPLISARYAPDNQSWSQYAHNALLEILSEDGIVGFLLMSFITGSLLWTCISAFRKPGPSVVFATTDAPLLAGLLLTLAYSFIELNLNFLVVWMLFWAILGILCGGMRQEGASEGKNDAPAIVLPAVLLLYAVFGITAIAAGELFPESYIGAVIPPFYERLADNYLVSVDRKRELIPDEVGTNDIFEHLHSNNPFFLIRMARVADWHGERVRLYRKAIDAMPSNTEFYASFFRYLAASEVYQEFGSQFKTMTQQMIPDWYLDIVDTIPYNSDSFVYYYTPKLLDFAGIPREPNDFLAKMYYYLGAQFIQSNPWLTNDLWTIAIGLSPGTSAYYMEAANLQAKTLGYEEAAKGTLNNCIERTLNEECKQQLNDYPNFGLLGDHELQIYSIR